MSDELPRIGWRPTPDDDITQALGAAQRALLSHPAAARAGFSALVAEGRAFAETPEGAHWQARLGASELVQRAHLVFDNVSLWLLEEDEQRLLPSGLIDALASASGSADRELLLDRLFRELDGSR